MKCKISIPHCCGGALTLDFSVPGREYKCPTCGAYYEFFDGFQRLSLAAMTEAQKQLAAERGWVVTEEESA